jgi:hypothetical protein
MDGSSHINNYGWPGASLLVVSQTPPVALSASGTPLVVWSPCLQVDPNGRAVSKLTPRWPGWPLCYPIRNEDVLLTPHSRSTLLWRASSHHSIVGVTLPVPRPAKPDDSTSSLQINAGDLLGMHPPIPGKPLWRWVMKMYEYFSKNPKWSAQEESSLAGRYRAYPVWVHSKFFGVDFKCTPKILEWTWGALQNFWSGLQVHSKFLEWIEPPLPNTPD